MNEETRKHTPGPWATDAGIVWSKAVAQDGQGRSKLVCRASRANAARIVSLENSNTELARALRILLTRLGDDVIYHRDAVDLARAAIAKAVQS